DLLLGVVAAAGGPHRRQVSLAQRRLVAGGVRARLEEKHDLPGPALAGVDELRDPAGEDAGLRLAPAVPRRAEPDLVGQEQVDPPAGRGRAVEHALGEQRVVAVGNSRAYASFTASSTCGRER